MGKFYRFVIVGIVNTVIGIGVIFGAKQFTDDITANMIAYLVVVPLTFYFHRNVTFRDSGHYVYAFIRYVSSTAIGYLCNRLVLIWSLSIGTNAYLAQFLAIGSHVVAVFFLSSIFVFVNQSGRRD